MTGRRRRVWSARRTREVACHDLTRVIGHAAGELYGDLARYFVYYHGDARARALSESL